MSCKWTRKFLCPPRIYRGYSCLHACVCCIQVQHVRTAPGTSTDPLTRIFSAQQATATCKHLRHHRFCRPALLLWMPPQPPVTLTSIVTIHHQELSTPQTPASHCQATNITAILPRPAPRAGTTPQSATAQASASSALTAPQLLELHRRALMTARCCCPAGSTPTLPTLMQASRCVT